MKLLLYCTKAKPYLFPTNLVSQLNGKIVAECDFEVEEIRLVGKKDLNFETKTLSEYELCKKSCLKAINLDDYLDLYRRREIYGYAIHIKNLHIFDEPKELSDYYKWFTTHTLIDIDKAPQNMMYAYEYEECNNEDYYNMNILISIQPQWLCKILNGEKTIEVRKKVLKEMLK